MAQAENPQAVAAPQAGNAQPAFTPQDEAAQAQALQFNQQQQGVMQAQAKQQLYQLVASIDSLLSSLKTPGLNNMGASQAALNPGALGATNGAYGLNTLNYPYNASGGALGGLSQGQPAFAGLYPQTAFAPQANPLSSPLYAGGGLTL